MSLEDILSSNSGRRPNNRVGRGAASGNGKTCGRGHKGEGSRSGGTNRGPLFEGGAMPFWMKIPKRGFSNAVHTKRYQVVSLARALQRVDGDVIDLETLTKAGLADQNERIKLVLVLLLTARSRLKFIKSLPVSAKRSKKQAAL